MGIQINPGINILAWADEACKVVSKPVGAVTTAVSEPIAAAAMTVEDMTKGNFDIAGSFDKHSSEVEAVAAECAEEAQAQAYNTFVNPIGATVNSATSAAEAIFTEGDFCDNYISSMNSKTEQDILTRRAGWNTILQTEADKNADSMKEDATNIGNTLTEWLTPFGEDGVNPTGCIIWSIIAILLIVVILYLLKGFRISAKAKKLEKYNKYTEYSLTKKDAQLRAEIANATAQADVKYKIDTVNF